MLTAMSNGHSKPTPKVLLSEILSGIFIMAVVVGITWNRVPAWLYGISLLILLSGMWFSLRHRTRRRVAD